MQYTRACSTSQPSTPETAVEELVNELLTFQSLGKWDIRELAYLKTHLFPCFTFSNPSVRYPFEGVGQLRGWARSLRDRGIEPACEARLRIGAVLDEWCVMNEG